MKRMEVEIKDKRLFLIFCGIFSLILLTLKAHCVSTKCRVAEVTRVTHLGSEKVLIQQHGFSTKSSNLLRNNYKL